MLNDEVENAIESETGFGSSISGKIWQLRKSDERIVKHLIQELNISETLANLIVNRGVKSLEEASDYLDPKIKNLLPDPFALKDMDKAAQRIAEAIINKEKITIFGDYDVDGATSSALLKRFFIALGIEAEIYIPHRVNEGYGPNIGAMDKIHSGGSSLVITVDCGIVSYEPLAHAKKIGLDVIVLDHHLGSEKLPEAVAIVNPNRFDDTFPFKNLAAVSVAFITTIAVRTVLRMKQYFADSVKEPDLMMFLDLVALGTVCDVMDLIKLNRAFVKQGLKLIMKRSNKGLATLVNMLNMGTVPKPHHLGFIIGPRINAGGRVGEGSLGARLLSTDDGIEALKIAKKLDDLNYERRMIENDVFKMAIEQIESRGIEKNPVIMVCGNNWHLGILGIIASKLKERYGKPAVAISIVGGEGKGSARSIPGIDFGTAITQAKNDGIVIDGGGHAMAGGFTIEESKIPKFYEFLIARAGNCEKYIHLAKILNADLVSTVEGITFDLAILIEKAAPFGSGNPQPLIIIKDALVTRVSIIGQEHIMLIIRDKYSVSSSPRTLKAMVYRATDKKMLDFLMSSVGKVFNFIGSIQFNNWYKEKVDFVIEDISVI